MLMSDPTETPTPTAADPAARLQELWQQGQRPDVREFVAAAGIAGAADLVAVLRADQRFRWLTGQRVLAEEYLAQFPVLKEDPETAAALVAGEYLLRRALGEEPSLDEYLQRFPDLAGNLRQRLLATPAVEEITRPASDSSPATLSVDAPSYHQPGAGPGLSGYDLLGELGRGGMGVVYRAQDRRRGRMVALKTMQGLDAAALWRFKQEFRSLAGLSHPNLVTLHELVGEGPCWFFTMELLQGVSMLEYVRGRGTAAPPTLEGPPDGPGGVAVTRSLPPALSAEQQGRLREVLRQLAGAVHFLHEKGIVHRDIKPGNVMVTTEGRVVLLDFGLATELDRRGQHRSIHLLGTVAYMAPEQAACRAVTPASDWYAVGVLLYEALSGRLPFDGDMTQVLLDKQQRDPPPVEALAVGLPGDLTQLCRELLRRPPEARPTGADLLRQLGADAAAPLPAPPAPAGPDALLVGRESHLAELASAFAAMRGGEAVTVFVHGRSGAGKTALVQSFLDGLCERGEAVVLTGRCYEQESVPYKALDSLVDGLDRYLDSLARAEVEALLPRDLAALARVFPVLADLRPAGGTRRVAEMGEPQEVRRRGLAALRELLARLGDRRPLVLAIDDLQWGDVDSAAVLADLLRPPDPPVLLLVACYRREDAETSPCLRALREALPPGAGPACRELAVEPLGPEQRRELARSLLGNTEEAALQAEAVAEQSGGYPFFVYELVQYLRAGRPLDGTTPDLTLSGVLWARVGQLSQGARRLLEVVAVAGRPLAQDRACAAAGLGGEEQTALAALRAARLIRGVGPTDREQVETYHDRVRETVLARLDAAMLRGHHRRLAELLEVSTDADPEALAVHWDGAGEPVRAGGHYARAADQAAAALAFERAAKLYRRALELTPAEAARAGGLRARLGDALANAGRGAEAAGAYLEAAADAAEALRLELQRRAALQLLCCGHVDGGLDVLRSVLSAVGLRMPATPWRALWHLVWERLRLRLRGLRFTQRPAGDIAASKMQRLDACATAAAGLSLVETIQGAFFQARSLRLALRCGEPGHVVSALAMEAAHESVSGGRGLGRAEHLLRLADEMARQSGDPYSRALVDMAGGITAALAGRWRQGAELCERAETIFRESCRGVMWELGTAYRFGLWPRMFMGQAAAIERRLPTLRREAYDRDDLYTVTNLTLVIGTFARMAADEPGRARGELDEVMARWSRSGFHVQHMNRLYDEVQLDLYEGDSAGAWRRLQEGWGFIERSYLLLIQQVRIFLSDLRARTALAAAAAADPEPYLRLASREARRLRRQRTAWATALAHFIEAGVVHRRGDTAAAAALYAVAAGLLRGVDMSGYAAAADRRQGELLGGEEGKALVVRANALMAAEGVRNIPRMTALLAPAGAGAS
jgi:hypothetical protein